MPQPRLAGTRVEIADAVSDPSWDEFVEATPGGDHLQSSGWAGTKTAHGLEAVRVVVKREARIVAGAQVLIKPMSIAGAIGYVPRGPVVPPGEADLAELVIAELQEIARRRRIRHLIVQPALHSDWVAEKLPARGFRPSAVSVAPTATVLIDLSADVDDLFADLGKSARKHVRRGAREGLTVREGGARDVAQFHELMAATSARLGFTPYSREYFETMWRQLHQRDHIRLFFGEYQREVVSAHLVVPFGDRFLSKAAAWSGTHARAYPNEVLEWYLIEWAKAHGFRYYDLEGIARESAEAIVGDPTTRQVRSADAFKLKFGGEVVLLPKAYDYFPSRVVANTYGRAYPVLTSAAWPKPVIASLRTRSWTRQGSS